jgi:hypothetical protein
MERKTSRRNLLATAGALAGTAIGATAAYAAGFNAGKVPNNGGGRGRSSTIVRAGPLASPENSTINIVNGKPTVPSGAPNYDPTTGNPVISDINGVQFSFVVDGNENAVVMPLPATNQYGYETGYEVSANGTVWANGGTQLIVRQGNVYVLGRWIRGGQPIGSAGTPFYYEYPSGNPSAMLPPPLNATPPSGGGAATAGGMMPPDPAPASVAPGSTGTVILAGPSQATKTLAAAVAAARPGDTVRLDAGAVFNESVLIDKPLLIDGQGEVANPGTQGASFSGGAIIDGIGIADPSGYAHQLGGLVPMTDCIIRGCEVHGFGLQEAGPGGIGGIRNGAPGRFVVDNCYVHDCQMGIYSGGFAADWTFNNVLIQNCGLGATSGAASHNIYLSGEVVHALARSVTSNIPTTTAAANRATGKMGGGIAFKSRAKAPVIIGGWFHSGDYADIEIADGSAEAAVVINAMLHKDATDPNHLLIQYGVESTKSGTAGLIMVGTLDAHCPSPLIEVVANCVVDITGSQITGNPVALSGAGKLIGP